MSREDWPESTPAAALRDETERKPWRLGMPSGDTTFKPHASFGRCSRCKQEIVDVQPIVAVPTRQLADGTVVSSARHVRCYHPNCWELVQVWYVRRNQPLPSIIHQH